MGKGYDFPEDILNTIISKLDIDTRRSLGIYTRLKIPDELKVKISMTFKDLQRGKKCSLVEIGPLRTPFKDDFEDTLQIPMKMYQLARLWHEFDTFPNHPPEELVEYVVCHISSELNDYGDYYSEYQIESYDLIEY
jgi:hypothetical protein